MRRHLTAAFYLMIVTIALQVIALSLLHWLPEQAESWDRSLADHLWMAELSLPPTRIEDHATTVVPAIERLLRGRSYVKDLNISLQNNKTFVFFRTSGGDSLPEISRDLERNLNALTREGICLWYAYLSRSMSESEQFSDVIGNLFRQLEQQDRNASLFALANPDLVLKWSSKLSSDPEISSLDVLLQRLEAIPGVQHAIARKVNIPFLQLDFDPRDLVRMGLPPDVIQKTMARHFRSNPAQPVSLLGRNSSITQEKVNNENEICDLSFPTADGRSLLRVCDLGKLGRSAARLDYYFPAKADQLLTEQVSNKYPADQQEMPEIHIFLDSTARVATAAMQVRQALAQSNSSSLWQVFRKKPAPDWARWHALNAAFILVALVAASHPTPKRQILMSSCCAAACWLACLQAFSIQPSPLGTVGLICSLVMALTARSLWASIPKHLPRWIPSLFSAAWLLGMGLGIHFTARLVFGQGEPISELLGIGFALAIPVAVSAHMSASSSLMASPSELHHHKGRGWWFLAASLLCIAAAAALPDRSSRRFWVQIGTDDPKDARATLEAVPIIQELLSSKNQLQFFGPRLAPQFQITPSRFALLGKSPLSAHEVLGSLVPSVAGHLKENDGKALPILVEGHISSEFSKSLDGFLNWLHSVQQPQTPGGKSSTERRFVSLFSLVEPEWKSDLTLLPSTPEGFGSLFRMQNVDPDLRTKLEKALLEFKARRMPRAQIQMSHEDDLRRTEVLRSWRAKLALVLLVTFAGAIHFASTRRALLTGMTFLLLERFLVAVVSLTGTFVTIPNMNSFPNPCTWTAAVLLVFWSIMLKTSDYRRAANMTLELAFAPTLSVSRQARKLGAIACLFVLPVSLIGNEFAWITPLLLAFWLAIGWLIPNWILLATHFAEIANRLNLRVRVMMSLQGALLLAGISAALFVPNRALAQGTTAIVDSRCQGTATLILPIVGRPKGKEAVPLRAIFSERLVQETPCAWFSGSLASEIISIVQEHRDSTNLDEIVANMQLLVEKKRETLEKELANHIPPGGASERRIYGGFYEEFYGNIAFTIIDFRKEGEPIIAKMTFPEEQQTQGIASIAEYLRGESTKFYEEFLGESERLPVMIERVESLDKHPVSENLAGEMNLFLRSRFLYPISFDWFERKTFFRAERDPSKAKYTLNVKIRRDGTRFYSSITTRSKGDIQRQTAWIEGDVSRMPAFEEAVLAASKRTLTSLEGLTDYCVALSLDFFTDLLSMTRMYGLTFRQNLGNAATTLRLRNGDHRAHLTDQKYSLLAIGGAVGWQFIDLRWFGADMGLSTDAGLASNSTKGNSSRSVFLTFGSYIQSQVLLKSNIAALARFGLEQPQLIGSQNLRDSVFNSFYVNTHLGLGITF